MELRSETSQPGRWVLAPKKGARFVGPRQRARLRARERRRRIFVVLLEAMALTALIGLFPPLRAMLVVTGALAFLLAVYLGLVVRMVGLQAETQPVLPPGSTAVALRVLHDNGGAHRQRGGAHRERGLAGVGGR
ncbi:MAG: hypothetical protein ACRDI0_12470 [Actinomycetota bacterium]